jgi:hypothetical protein
VDYNSSALAVGSWNSVGNPSSYTLHFSGSSAALTSLVNSWNSGENGGLLLGGLTNFGTSSYVLFYGGSAPDAALTPELTVTYESVSVPEPDAFLLFGMSMLVIVGYVKCRKRKNAPDC